MAWLFEYDTTAYQSEEHARSLKWLTTLYWVPMILLGFYANFLFPDMSFFGLLLMIPITAIACCVSYKKFKRTDETLVDGSRNLSSWFNEILYCGVNKLSMSITALSGLCKAQGFAARKPIS